MNVRQAEQLAKAGKPAASRSRRLPDKDPNTAALEDNLAQLLGLKVTVQIRGEGGSLKIDYETLDQLDDVLHRLTHGPRLQGEQD